ncbi:MAG: hypothetical protein RIF39_14450 [Cyclobacteriaceae bacterium]
MSSVDFVLFLSGIDTLTKYSNKRSGGSLNEMVWLVQSRLMQELCRIYVIEDTPFVLVLESFSLDPKLFFTTFSSIPFMAKLKYLSLGNLNYPIFLLGSSYPH